MRTYKKSIILTVAVIAAVTAYPQDGNNGELQKSIVIEKDFVPVETDAKKMDVLPQEAPFTAVRTELSFSDWAVPATVEPMLLRQAPMKYSDPSLAPYRKRGYAGFAAGNYLNMEFYIPVKGNSSTAHFINLVVDDVAPATNDTVYVTLRHNAYDDKPGEGRVPGDYRWAWGNVSFDLTSLLPEGATSVPVKLTWTGYKGGNFGETEVHTESGVFTLSAETKALAGGLNDSRSNAESATAQTPTVTCR